MRNLLLGGVSLGHLQETWEFACAEGKDGDEPISDDPWFLVTGPLQSLTASPEKWKLERDIINIYKHLKGLTKKAEPVVSHDRKEVTNTVWITGVFFWTVSHCSLSWSGSCSVSIQVILSLPARAFVHQLW